MLRIKSIRQHINKHLFKIANSTKIYNISLFSIEEYFVVVFAFKFLNQNDIDIVKLFYTFYKINSNIIFYAFSTSLSNI